MRETLLRVCSALICAGAMVDARATNVLTNGGFESGTFIGWNEAGGAVISTDPVHEGTRAARVSSGELRATFPTSVGARFKVTAWVRILSETRVGSDTWGGFRVTISDGSSWNELGTSGYLLSGTHGTEWFKIAYTFTALGGQSRVQIGRFGGAGLSMVGQVDDVQVFPVGVNVPPQIVSTNLTPIDLDNVPGTQAFAVAAGDADGAIRTIAWDFGDGTRAQAASGSRRVAVPGSFLARVSVSDDDGAISSVSIPWSAVAAGWPSLSIEQPAAAAVVAAPSVTFTGSAAPTSIVRVTGDRGLAGHTTVAAGSGAWVAEVALAPGWNRLLVQANDGSGHVVTAERNVRYVPAADLAVQVLSSTPGPVECWDEHTVTFAIVGSAATHPHLPYEATPVAGIEWVDGVTADAVFTPDDWVTTFRRPAFLRQGYSRALKDAEEWLYPDGSPVWTAVFSPPRTGTWRYRIEVTEARGTARSTEGSFTVVAPTSPLNHGPVRVSATDSRYFEYADGTPYLGGGHGIGLSAERFSYDAATQFAAIGAGNQQLLRLWIGGQLWGAAWQPWSSLTLGYEATVPAQGLSLERAYGDSLASWRLDANNPLWFQGWNSGHAPVIPGRTYRLRVRWRTEGVVGPATLGAPYGLCVKLTHWPTVGQTGAFPAIVQHVRGDTPWHVAEGDFTATTNILPNLALILENTTGGSAWVDELTLFEVLPGGALGPQLLRSPRADSVREYDPRRGAGLEQVLAEAKARDMQLRLVIGEKQEFLLGHRGTDGLPAPLGEQYFGVAGTANRRLHEYYWRHLSARLGASRAVHSWELVNEAAPGPGAHIDLAADLAARASADGNPHLAGISTWASLAPTAWTSPSGSQIGHADFHCYVRGTGWIEPKDQLADDSARFFHEYDLAARAAGLGRPVVWGEQGIDGQSGTDGEDSALASDTAGIWLHKLTWARTGPGGVYPIYWYTDNIVGRSLHGRFGAWRRFMAGIPLANGLYRDVAATASHPGMRVLGQRDTTHGRAHLWIDNRSHTWRAVVTGASSAPVSGTVQVDLGAANAPVLATWHDTTSGAPIRTESLVANSAGIVTLQVDGLATDAAVKLAALPLAPTTQDWPQFQRDFARTGRTSTAVPPPFRPRWIWLGPGQTLRNRDSQAGWPDDLTPRSGYTYPNWPASVPFTISEGVQPVIASGRVFVGTMEGQAYAIDAHDGATLWSAALPGPTVASAAVSGATAVFTCATGEIVGLDTQTGAVTWTHTTPKAIVSAPCVVGDLVAAGSQDGRVYAVSESTGALAWMSAPLGRSIHGGLCSDGSSLYVGSENMTVHALSLADGTVRASRVVRGQTFRMTWPVYFNGRLFVTTGAIPHLGSEYIGESNGGSQLFADGTDLASEEANLLRWLAGDTSAGRWPDAGRDWKHLFALDTVDLSEPFVIPAAPVDGVGAISPSPVVDNSDRVLTYFKTKFPTLTRANGGVFGTNFSVDIAAIHPGTGRRVPIDNGHLANPWPWETDNLYGMSVAGSQLWLRQVFRGTQMIDLATSTSRGVTAAVRSRDGGVFNFDVVYQDTGQPPGTPQRPFEGRAAPAIAGGRVYVADTWGITAIEHQP